MQSTSHLHWHVQSIVKEYGSLVSTSAGRKCAKQAEVQASRLPRIWMKPRHRTHCPQAEQATAEVSCSREVAELKKRLIADLTEIDSRGVYGLNAASMALVKDSIGLLEAQNPVPSPTDRFDLLAGNWEVLFTSTKVTGSRRVKLGLRDMVHISHISQEIDVAAKCAVNRVGFRIPAFRVNSGELVMKASYEVASHNRVTIKLQEATLAPKMLQSLFEANFDLLLSIFNPEGYLDITYCDHNLRCGRDDKGHVFVLQKLGDQ